MKQSLTYDFVIAGGGAAGLSLTYWLVQSSLADKKILILDKHPKVENDKTWCFWSKEALPFQSSKQVSWDTLSVSHQEGRFRASISPYRYYHTRSQDFYEEMRTIFKQYPNVSIKYEAIQDWGSNDDMAWVRTTQQTYQAKWLFNSLPPLNTDRSSKEIWTAQHFLGLRIQTSRPCFDPSCVELMDFRVSQIAGSCFMYVLPFSPTEALLEFTSFSPKTFSPKVYKQEISKYLATQYHLKEWTVIEEERGLIPMTTQSFVRQAGSRILNIGTRGGMTKASTGYTFLPIQRDSQQIVQSLLAHGHPFDLVKQKPRHRFFDHLLLRVIQDEPEQIPRIMKMLFQHRKHPKVLQFLDESSSFFSDISLILRLPWSPFLRALWNSITYGTLFSHAQLPLGRDQSDPVVPVSDLAPLAYRSGMEPVYPADGSQRHSARRY